MKVYRIVFVGSDGTEKGPYQLFDDNIFDDDQIEFCVQINDAHMDSDHPCPPDSVRYGDIRQRSCCTSMEKLMKWFSGFWDDIIILGGTVREYEITDDDIIYADAFQVLVKQTALK